MKFDIQTFTDSDDSVRFTFYESWYNKSIIIVKEERFTDEDWTVVNSLSVPKDLFGLMNAKGSTDTRDNPGASVETDVTFLARTLTDRLELPIHVRRTILERDCEEIPLYENQTGYFNDLETLEWFWDVPQENSNEMKAESSNQLYSNLAVETSSMESEGEFFMFENSSQSVLAVPPCDESSNEGEAFVYESPQTPMKATSTVSPDCPPAPKKRRLIRRPSFGTRMKPLSFSQFWFEKFSMSNFYMLLFL